MASKSRKRKSSSRSRARATRRAESQLNARVQLHQTLEPLTPRVGSVIAPPLVTLHNYENTTIVFINGRERRRIISTETINHLAFVLTELQREGAISIAAADFRQLSTEL